MEPVRETRVDRISVRLDATNHTTTPQGFLRVWGTVVSGDQFLEYDKADGAEKDGFVEFVPSREVSDTASLKTLEFAPITFLHPPTPLTAANTSEYKRGTVIDVKWDGTHVRVHHQIEDQTTIEAIRGGAFELSLAYTAVIDRTPGEFQGRRYDAIQRARIYNHDAIVPEGRAAGAALDRIDSARRAFRCDRLAISKTQQNKRDDQSMAKTIVIGADSFEVATQVADKLERMQAQLDDKDGDGENKDVHEGGSSHEEEEEEEDKKTDEDGNDKTNEDDEPKAGGRSDSALTAAEVTRIFADGLKGFRAENRKDAKREEEKRTKREDAEKTRTADITLAKDYLPESYRFDGKPSAEILHAAAINTKPEMKVSLEAYKADAAYLRGILAALRHQNPRAGGSLGSGMQEAEDPNVTRIDAARKKRDDQVKLTQAQLIHGRIGNQAVRKVVFQQMEADVKAGE